MILDMDVIEKQATKDHQLRKSILTIPQYLVEEQIIRDDQLLVAVSSLAPPLSLMALLRMRDN